MTSESPGVIRVTHAFTASAERVFDAWIKPEKVARWLLPDTAGKARPVAVGTGADESIRCITYCAGRAVEHTVEYLEIQRPYRLSFTIRNSASAEKERVTVLIEPRGAGCFLTLISGIERGPLRTLTPLAVLTPFRAEKAVRPRLPTVEAKAVLSLGLHLAMLPLLPIVLREPAPLPGAVATPTRAMITVDLATGEGVRLAERLDVPVVVSPGKPAAIAPRLRSASAAPTPMQQSPAAASRPVPPANTRRIALPVPQPRTTAQPIRTLHDQRVSDGPPGPRPLYALGAPSYSTNGPDLMTSRRGAAGEEGEGLRQRTRAASAQVEPPLFGTSCIGTVIFSPDSGIGTYHGGQKTSVQANFFRDGDGRPWVRFTLWPGAPWNLPVTISANEIRWTGVGGSGYALWPVGNNHLAGFAGFNIDYAAKIDFICAGLDAHPT
jgi:uncharacterized protein YndB with AHSA1/START domain